MMGEEEVKSGIQAIIEQVGAKGPGDLGKVMGVAARELSGHADGRAISMAVNELLSNTDF